jgi:hypothetical protein
LLSLRILLDIRRNKGISGDTYSSVAAFGAAGSAGRWFFESITVPSAIAATTAISAGRASIFLRPCLIYIEGSALKFTPVKFRDCAIRFAADGHFDKPEASGLPGVTVGHEIDALDRPVRLK